MVTQADKAQAESIIHGMRMRTLDCEKGNSTSATGWLTIIRDGCMSSEDGDDGISK